MSDRPTAYPSDQLRSPSRRPARARHGPARRRSLGLGPHLRAGHVHLVRRARVRVVAVPVFGRALGLASWAAPRVRPAWLHHSDGVRELGAAPWTGRVLTPGLFGCSTVLVVCFLAWVPRRGTWCTALGAGTLYGGLPHGFLAGGALFGGGPEAHPWLREPLGEVVVTAVAALVVTALPTPPVRRVFRFAMEPTMAWAFRADPAETRRRPPRAGG